jgi:hypothetical protein
MSDELEEYIILSESDVNITKNNITLNSDLDLPQSNKFKIIIRKEDGETVVSDLLRFKEETFEGETVKTLEPVYAKINPETNPQFQIGDVKIDEPPIDIIINPSDSVLPEHKDTSIKKR